MPEYYCTDERIAAHAPGDFVQLCPRHQRLASGVDGQFIDPDLWILHSDALDFEARGIAEGEVIQLQQPEGLYSGNAGVLAVASVSGKDATLRRLGLANGEGEPPGPAGGTMGVAFLITTMKPQIGNASRQLDRSYKIGEQWGTLSEDDKDQVRDACAYWVLWHQYLAMARHSGEIQDDYAAKARLFAARFKDKEASVLLRSRTDGGGGDTASPIFGRATR